MVSQRRRPAPDSRARLLAAAAAEFAARGFDGAKVDRIAARARVNKAMLYYHFHDKAALYREILRGVFGAVAEGVEAVRARGGAPDSQLRAFIASIADGAIDRPYFPSLWLREMADGGRHLDEPVVAQLRRVLAVLAGILRDGRATGFSEIHPLVAQIGIVAPLLFFAATAPVRVRFKDKVPDAIADISHDAMVAHVQDMTLAAVGAAGRSAQAASPPAARRPATSSATPRRRR